MPFPVSEAQCLYRDPLSSGKVLQADGGGDVFGGDAARGGRNGLAEQKNDGQGQNG